MVRAIFKNVVLTAAGPLPGQFTDDNLAKWIELRKGTFSRELDERVTHLLCTEELLRERGPRGMPPFPPRSCPSPLSFPIFLFTATKVEMTDKGVSKSCSNAIQKDLPHRRRLAQHLLHPREEAEGKGV